MNNKLMRSFKRQFNWVIACTVTLAGTSVLANGLGENNDWRFQISSDKVNAAVVQDMIQKRNMGYYTAPVYTTNIARQINCNQTASSTGNLGSLGAAALSPSTSGATSSSTGNANANTNSAAGTTGSTQSNPGTVGASVNGNNTADVSGSSTQALNSTQTNGGTQGSSVTGSTGCTFGVLN